MRGNKSSALRRAIRDEEGATATEYGLIVLLVAVAIIGSLWVYSETISQMYTAEAGVISGVVATVE